MPSCEPECTARSAVTLWLVVRDHGRPLARKIPLASRALVVWRKYAGLNDTETCSVPMTRTVEYRPRELLTPTSIQSASPAPTEKPSPAFAVERPGSVPG